MPRSTTHSPASRLVGAAAAAAEKRTAIHAHSNARRAQQVESIQSRTACSRYGSCAADAIC